MKLASTVGSALALTSSWASCNAGDCDPLMLFDPGPDATISTGSDPIGPALCDLDRDGDLDLVVPNFTGAAVELYENNGTGGFTFVSSLPTPDRPYQVRCGHLDPDGEIDIVGVCSTGNRLIVLRGTGPFAFSAVETYPDGTSEPRDVAIGDEDEDGLIDCIVIANWVGDNAAVYSVSAGAPVLSTTIAGGNETEGVDLADINGDGMLDLIMMSTAPGQIRVALGDGSCSFDSPTLIYSTSGVVRGYAVDVTLNDVHLPDIVVAAGGQDQIHTLVNDGSGSFPDAVVSAGGGSNFQMSFADFNADGLMDVCAGNNLSSSASVLFGDGTGAFPVVTTFPTGTPGNQSVAAVAGDLDGDSSPDFISTQSDPDAFNVFLSNCTRPSVQECEDQIIANPDSSPDNAWDAFANSITIDGNRAAISLRTDDPEIDGSGPIRDAGSVQMYEYNLQSMLWVATQRLIASDAAEDDNFGQSLHLEADVLVVGAREHDISPGGNEGVVYVFEFAAGTWIETQQIQSPAPAPNEQFGIDVDLWGDWLAVGTNADEAGSMADGSVHLYERVDGTWQYSQTLTSTDASDRFGVRVAMDDGRLVASAFGGNPDVLYTYALANNTWLPTETLSPPSGVTSRLGIGLDLEGELLIAGDDLTGPVETGRAHIFRLVDDSWAYEQMLRSNLGIGIERFGQQVAISDNHVVVGGPGRSDGYCQPGSAYVFEDRGEWTFLARLLGSDSVAEEVFGIVAFDFPHVICGAPSFDDGLDSNTGRAYAYRVPFAIDPDDSCDIEFDLPGSFICPGDIDHNGMLDTVDLLHLLAEWGGDDSTADIVCDGDVNTTDLLQLLANWGPCE